MLERFVAFLKKLIAHCANSSISKKAPHNSDYRVVADDREVISKHADGETDSILWKDITLVHVEIVAEGGFLPETPWWLLFGKNDSYCRFPYDAAGAKDTVEKFGLYLEGYRTPPVLKRVISAIGATNGTFEIWSVDADSSNKGSQHA